MKRFFLMGLMGVVGLMEACADPTNVPTPGNSAFMIDTNGAMANHTNFFTANAAAASSQLGLTAMQAGIDSNTAAIMLVLPLTTWGTETGIYWQIFNSNATWKASIDAQIANYTTSNVSRTEFATNNDAISVRFQTMDANTNGVPDSVDVVPVHNQDWDTITDAPNFVVNQGVNVTLTFSKAVGVNPLASNEYATKDYVDVNGGGSNWVGSKGGKWTITNNPSGYGQGILFNTNGTAYWGYPTGVQFTAVATNVPLSSVLDAGDDANGHAIRDLGFVEAISGSIGRLTADVDLMGHTISDGTFDGVHLGTFPGFMTSNNAAARFYPISGGDVLGSMFFPGSGTNVIQFGLNGSGGIVWKYQFASPSTNFAKLIYDPSAGTLTIAGHRLFREDMTLPGFTADDTIVAPLFSGSGASLSDVDALMIGGRTTQAMDLAYFNADGSEVMTNALKILGPGAASNAVIEKPYVTGNSGALVIKTDGPPTNTAAPANLVLVTERGSSTTATGGQFVVQSEAEVLISSANRTNTGERGRDITIRGGNGGFTAKGADITFIAGDGGPQGGPAGVGGSIYFSAGNSPQGTAGVFTIRAGTGVVDGVIQLLGSITASGGITVPVLRVTSQLGVGSNVVSGPASAAIGTTNNVSGTNSFASGRGNRVSQRDNGAIGYGNVVSAPNGFAAGNLNQVSADTGVALGEQAIVTNRHAMVLSDGSTGQVASTRDNSLVLSFSNGVDIVTQGGAPVKVNGLDISLGGGTHTAGEEVVTFENLDSNGDVGPASNQVLRGSDLTSSSAILAAMISAEAAIRASWSGSNTALIAAEASSRAASDATQATAIAASVSSLDYTNASLTNSTMSGGKLHLGTNNPSSGSFTITNNWNALTNIVASDDGIHFQWISAPSGGGSGPTNWVAQNDASGIVSNYVLRRGTASVDSIEAFWP